MGRYRVLLKKVERLMANYTADCHQVTLRDGTRHWLKFSQIMRGCSDSLAGVRSYEGVVMSGAVTSSSEWAAKAIDLLDAVRPQREGVR